MKKLLVLLSIISLFTLAGCFSKGDKLQEIENSTTQVQSIHLSNGQEIYSKGDSGVMKLDEPQEIIETHDEVVDSDENEVKALESESIQTEKETAAQGSYISYSDSMLGNTDDTVIFFYASWCVSCRAADDNISVAVIPEGLTILKADFDSDTQLRKKYGVVAQHTFVQVDSSGNEIKKWVGGTSIESILERLQ